MNGQLTAEICDSNLLCCNAGNLDSDRDDFNKGHVDVFYGVQIRECSDFEMGDGGAIMIITHNGIDAWKGDWLRWMRYCIVLRIIMLKCYFKG